MNYYTQNSKRNSEVIVEFMFYKFIDLKKFTKFNDDFSKKLNEIKFEDMKKVKE